MNPLVRELSDQTDRSELDAHLTLGVQSHEAWQARDRLAKSGVLRDAFFKHVVATVPFFRDYFGARQSPVSLRDFPVTARAGFDLRRESFLSSAFRDEAFELVLSTNRTFDDAVEVSFDRAALYEFNYAVWPFIADRFEGRLRGAFPPGKPGLIFISDGSQHTRSSQVVPPLRATLSRRLPLGHGADEAIVAYLRSIEVPLLTGKPSSLIRLADLDEALGAGRIRTRAIVTSGSSLYPDDRERITRHFDAPVRNAYVATEGGLMAIDCALQRGLHVREDRVMLEVMSDDGSIRDQGTGRLLLTNFFNWAHAFVRYEIGDRASLERGRCKCGFAGLTLVGLPSRDVTHFELGGTLLSTTALGPLLIHDDVSQFQAAQSVDGRLVIRFVPRPSGNGAVIAARIRASIWERFGAEAEVLAVDAVFPTGGKLRRFVIEEGRR